MLLCGGQFGVAPVEISVTIVRDAMTQDQILRTRRRTDGIELNEAQRANRALEITRRKERSCNRVGAELGDTCLSGHPRAAGLVNAESYSRRPQRIDDGEPRRARRRQEAADKAHD